MEHTLNTPDTNPAIIQWAMNRSQLLSDSKKGTDKTNAPAAVPENTGYDSPATGNRPKPSGNAKPFITVYNDILVLSTKAI